MLIVDDICPRSVCFALDQGSGVDFGPEDGDSLEALDRKRVIAVEDWLTSALASNGFHSINHRVRHIADAAWSLGVDEDDGLTWRTNVTTAISNTEGSGSDAGYTLSESLSGTGATHEATVIGRLTQFVGLEIFVNEEAVETKTVKLMVEYWSGKWKKLLPVVTQAEEDATLEEAQITARNEALEDPLADAQTTARTEALAADPGATEDELAAAADEVTEDDLAATDIATADKAAAAVTADNLDAADRAGRHDAFEDGTDGLKQSGRLSWLRPGDWRDRRIGGSEGGSSLWLFPIRFRLASGVVSVTTRTLGIFPIQQSRLTLPACYYALALLYNEADSASRGMWAEKAKMFFERADDMLQRAMPRLADEFDTDQSGAIRRTERADQSSVNTVIRG